MSCARSGSRGRARRSRRSGAARRRGRSRSARRGRGRRRRRRSRAVPLTRPSTTTRSKVRLAKRPTASAGRTTSRSIASSKYHLLTSRVWTGRRRRISIAGTSGPQHVAVVGDPDPEQGDRRRRSRGPSTPRRSRGGSRPAASPRRPARGTCRPRRRRRGPGRGRRRGRGRRARPSPPASATTARRCGARGPGSRPRCPPASPVAGLRGGSWATWPVSISSCASLHGVPGRMRKIRRKV